MPIKFAASVLSALAFLGGICTLAAADGPALGNWAFTGKDSTGLVWTGTLKIEKLDPNQFNSPGYYAMCDLEMTSTDESQGTKGVAAPCKFEAGKRTLSFTTGVMTVWTLSAVLSSDGKSLTMGKWTRTKADDPKTVLFSGEWSAKLPK